MENPFKDIFEKKEEGPKVHVVGGAVERTKEKAEEIKEQTRQEIKGYFGEKHLEDIDEGQIRKLEKSEYLKTKEEIRRVLFIIALSLSVVATYGILESAVRYNIFSHFKTVENPEIVRTTTSVAIRFGLYRARSTQMMPHVFGTALCMILPLQLFYFLYTKGRAKIFAGLATALIIGGIAVTYTRGVYLACALAVFLSFLYPE